MMSIISMLIVLGMMTVAGAMVRGAFILILDAELIRRGEKRTKNRKPSSLDRQVLEKRDSDSVEDAENLVFTAES